jgi:prepilin-type N-terminal cleavage/methylation domain-containing protein
VSKQRERSAFTLIELLVVIAIIAILASILFPVFARARENARRASCTSNLKQLGLGMMMYVQDYDGRFPSVAFAAGDYVACPNGVTSPPCSNNWAIRIYPYTKSVQVFNCPSDTRAWTGNSSAPSQIGYGYNQYLAYDINSSLEKPSQTILMADYEGKDRYALYQHNYYSTSDSTDVRYISDRHLNGSVLNFADGHAKWIHIARDPATNRTIPPQAAQGVYWKADGSS